MLSIERGADYKCAVVCVCPAPPLQFDSLTVASSPALILVIHKNAQLLAGDFATSGRVQATLVGPDLVRVSIERDGLEAGSSSLRDTQVWHVGL